MLDAQEMEQSYREYMYGFYRASRACFKSDQDSLDACI